MTSVTDSPEIGQIIETVFESNRNGDSPYRFRATRMDGRRAPKIILCDDDRVQPGKRCRVRVRSVKKPAARRRGHIEVEYLGQISLQLDDAYYADPLLMKKLQALLECGMNILLDGPQGSGKTILSRLIARALDMEYVFFNCASIYEPTDILATLSIDATESGHSKTVWITNDIYRALTLANEQYDRRFLIFLDEFNRCREMARNGIMPGLDSTRRLHNPLNNESMPIPDNVQWIAAINNGAQFSGTTSVDPAQLDRFAPIKMGYPPPAAEARILQARFPSTRPRQIKRVVKAANAIRNDKELRVDLSMRATQEVCELLSHANFIEFDGDAAAELMKTSFCGRFPGQWDDPSTDAGLVWQVIVRALNL